MKVQLKSKNMSYWFLGLFVGLPLLELFLLIQTGRLIGALPTVGLVILTGIVGGSLAHQQGFAIWSRIRTELNAGRLPGSELVEGLLILIAGIVLLTPGLITDLLGLALLIPRIRKVVLNRALEKLKSKMQSNRGPADIIDV